MERVRGATYLITGSTPAVHVWAKDEMRRAKAQLPDKIDFVTKPEIGHALIEGALALTP